MCSFRLQNFAKCLRAVKIASPRDGLRKGKGCKMLVIRRDSTKTKSKANPTLLRTETKDSVLNFSWRAIGQEILEKSPLFYRLLLASADPKSLSKSSDPETTERYPGICTAAAVLLKNRDKGMSLVHYVISTILKVGRT